MNGYNYKRMDTKNYILTGQNVRIGIHCASLAPRICALVIDVMLSLFYYYGLSRIMYDVNFGSKTLEWAFVLTFCLLPMYYFPLAETFFNGQTIGKRILGIRVVRSDGEPLTLANAALRFLLLPVDAMSGLGLVFIIMSARSQRLGDRAAGTMVVDDRAYRRTHVDLSDYDRVADRYKPLYVRASELTAKQARTIERVLTNRSKRRPELMAELAGKVSAVCGKRKCTLNTDEQYLTRVLNDYRYYQQSEE